MRRSTLAASVAASFCVGLTAPVFAAQTPVAGELGSEPTPG